MVFIHHMISAVIPAYNEEDVLEASSCVLAGVLSRLSPFGWEIIIVNDGSRDRTAQAASRLADDPHIRVIQHERNRGKGAAVRTGVLLTRGDAVLICDADMSTPPETLELFLAEFSRGADLVTGDRRDRRSRIARPQSLLRRVMGGVYAALARGITGISLRDFNCGFKLIRGDAARSLLKRCRSDGWTWDAEVISLAVRSGLVVRALPVTWRQGDHSSVRPFCAAAKSLIELTSLRLRLRGAKDG
jgi:dolichyl-phosphate beta-glucosyltransferase